VQVRLSAVPGLPAPGDEIADLHMVSDGPFPRATGTSPDNLDRHLPVPGEALSSGAVETEHAG
jgi:hypothetical protein